MQSIIKTWAMLLVFLLMTVGCTSALHNAAAKGDLDAIKKILDSGADIQEKGYNLKVEGPPLHHAAYHCQTEAVRLLLDRGAYINAVGVQDSTALYWAARGNCVKATALLIERGADLELATRLLASHKYQDGVRLVESQAGKAGKDRAGVVLHRDAQPPAGRSDIDELPRNKMKPDKNAYAIVIGIENYRQKLPKADFATGDATLVREYLTKVLGYPEENVITLLNDHAAYVDLAKYFEKWLPNNVDKGGTVFVYYSGHGAPDPKTGGAYLVPYDGDPSFIAETGYSLKRMYDALGKLPAKEIVVALDSCFSGAGGRSVLAKGARPLVMNVVLTQALTKNMTVLSASSGEQISSTYDEKGHGLFTYFLLRGIKYENVVTPDGTLKVEDLFGYVRPQVERIARKQFNNEQTPQLFGTKKE